MTEKSKNILVQIAVLIFCICNSRNLIPAWESSIFCRFGWIPFLIWTLPVLIVAAYKIEAPTLTGQGITSIVAIALSLIGVLGSLNVLTHIALAFAITSWLPARWMKVVLLISSPCWMPALGYFLRLNADQYMLPERIIAAGVSGFIILYKNSQNIRKKRHE